MTTSSTNLPPVPGSEEAQAKWETRTLRNAFIALVVVYAAFVALPFASELLPHADAKWLCRFKERLSQLGLIGDMFNAINTLFSLMTFGGVLYTIKLQRDELRRQMEQSVAQQVLNLEQLELIRQQREKYETDKVSEQVEKINRELTLFLNANAAMAQAYAQIYSRDPNYYDKEAKAKPFDTSKYQNWFDPSENWDWSKLDMTFLNADMTVKQRMDLCLKILAAASAAQMVALHNILAQSQAQGNKS